MARTGPFSAVVGRVLDHCSAEARVRHASALERHGASLTVKSGGKGTTAWLLADPPSHARFLGTSVYYLHDYLAPADIPNLLTDVPQVATSGDAHIELQGSRSAASEEAPLLTYEQRRLSRKKVIASPSRVRLTGGYHAPTHAYEPPIECVLISAAGAQFEMEHVEAQDFIIASWGSTARGNKTPLFPHLHEHTGGRKPSIEELESDSLRELRLALDGAPVFTRVNRGGPDCYLDRQAYLTAMTEDVTLILAAFDDMVGRINAGLVSGDESEAGEHAAAAKRKRGLFKATAIGMGYFAHLSRVGSIAHHLAPLLLEAWRVALTARPFHNIAVVEFPDFMRGAYTPAWGDEPVNGVRIEKGAARDVLMFSPAEQRDYVCGALNAGDCFCIPGNEFGYGSVEAMIGNNSDLRVVQNYVHNAFLLDERAYMAVKRDGATWSVVRESAAAVDGHDGAGGAGGSGGGGGAGAGAGAADAAAEAEAAAMGGAGGSEAK